jgi:hypothetical protein
MAVVVVMAVYLTLFRTVGGLLLILALGALGLVVVFGGVFRGRRRGAVWCFASSAIMVNALIATLCAYYFNMVGMLLMFLVSFFGVPLTLGAGGAWAVAATRRDATSRRSPLMAWPLVLSMAVAPVTMMTTHWPLHVAFIVSRPALDRLADRCAAGVVIRRPEWAGLYRVVGSDVDFATGNVGLIIDPNSSGHSGFVRLGSLVPSHPHSGPFFNLSSEAPMDARWWYQEED